MEPQHEPLTAFEANLVRWSLLTKALPDSEEKTLTESALNTSWHRYSDDMLAEHLTPSDRAYLGSIHITLATT